MVQDAENNCLDLYIDGEFVNTSAAINALTEDNLFIAYNGNGTGANADQGQFTGLIDDIRIYNCALSETYIEEISK